MALTLRQLGILRIVLTILLILNTIIMVILFNVSDYDYDFVYIHVSVYLILVIALIIVSFKIRHMILDDIRNRGGIVTAGVFIAPARGNVLVQGVQPGATHPPPAPGSFPAADPPPTYGAWSSGAPPYPAQSSAVYAQSAAPAPSAGGNNMQGYWNPAAPTAPARY